MPPTNSLLVVSAHAADFVWRAGGYVALHAKRGHPVTVVCLSYGERGESARLWRQGKSLTEVKAIRHAEAVKAAKVLGAELETFDAGDYPLNVTPDIVDRLARVYRRVMPSIVITHGANDPYNYDHATAHRTALEARVIAQAAGFDPGQEVLGAPPVFCFEPTQSEASDFVPDVLVDISEVWETKLEAMHAMEGQQHLWEYFTWMAQRRGYQAARNAGPNLGLTSARMAEAYERAYPQVTAELA